MKSNTKIAIFTWLLCLLTSHPTIQAKGNKDRIQSNKIILCTFLTPSHEVFLNEWLLPSIQDDFEIIIGRAPQECPTASFMKFGWTKTTKKKVLHVIDTIKNNMGRIMIFADVDIQFFGSIEAIIKEMLETNDFVIQKNDPKGGLCTGFFALYCNEKNLRLWKRTYEYMLTNNRKSDQTSFNHILKEKFNNKITWSYLPTSLFIGGGTFRSESWTPGDFLEVPPTILMHHANYSKGIENKLAQLEHVRDYIESN